jgi:predicted dehydrogenase
VPLRLAYVGCGFMAQKVHLPNFLSLPDVQVVGLAEVRPRLAEKVARRLGIPKVYRSHAEVAADPAVDAVAVSAAFAQQGEIAADLLRAGKHVFMEKPMAVSVEQAERILEAARQGGARLMVAYMKRYDDGNRLGREVVAAWRQSGEMGRITYVRAHGFCGDWVNNLETPMDTTDEPYPPAPAIRPAWLPETYAARYLGYLQQYTHNLNLVRWLLGSGPGEAVGVRAVDLDEDGLRGVAVLEISGVRVVLESGSIQYHAWDEHTQVFFERGWVRLSSPPLMVRNQPAGVEIYDGRRRERRELAGPWTWAYRREAEEFVRRLQSGEPFESSGEDTLQDVAAFEAIYRHWLTAKGVL